MRSIFTTLLCFWASLSFSQVATWMVKDTCSNIFFDKDVMFFKVTTDKYTHLYNQRGALLISLPYDYSIAEFREGKSVVVNGSTNTVYAILNEDEKMHILKNGLYKLENKYPFYSNGFLLTTSNGMFRFLNKNCKEVGSAYSYAQPFCEGYASVMEYVNPEKFKGQQSMLVDTKFNPCDIKLNGKSVRSNAITYISSVNADGLAFVALGKDCYMLDVKSGELSRLSITHSEDKKGFVTAKNEIYIYTVTAKAGEPLDLGRATLWLNGLMQIDSIKGGTYVYRTKRKKGYNKQWEKYLQTTYDEVHNVYGLDLTVSQNTDKVVLPPQFELVGDIVGHNAVVMHNGNYGIIQTLYKDNIEVSVNDGEPVAFTHRKYPSELKISLPVEIPSDEVESIECLTKNIIEVQNNTRVGNDTRQGNLLTYKCNLFVPDTLSGKRDIPIDFVVNYSGLKSKVIRTTCNMRFKNNYGVRILKTSQITSDTLYVEFEAVKINEDGVNYLVNADVLSNESLSKRIGHITENMFGAKLYDFNGPQQRIFFSIAEDGCPSAKFTYDIISQGTGKKKKVILQKVE